MQAIIVLNAMLALVLELAMVVAYGWAGYHAVRVPLIGWILGLGTAFAVALVWSLWAAPKAKFRLSQPKLFVLELGLMLLAAFLLWQTGQARLAFILAALATASQLAFLATSDSPLYKTPPDGSTKS